MMKPVGIVEICHYRDGKLIAFEVGKNLITNAGFAAGAARVGGISMDAFDYVAVGTGTTAADVTDTALESEITDSGLARAQDAAPSRSTTSVTNDTLEINYTWTVSGSKAITEAGLLNAAAAGTLFARRVFSAYNVVSGDTFAITWKVQFT